MKSISSDLIFKISSVEDFRKLALEIFRYQAAGCAVYSKFVRHLHIDPSKVSELSQIPFLPVEFFKTQTIVTGERTPKLVFTSSGTTGMQQSRHFVANPAVYETSFRDAFRLFYGDIRKYAVLALLPSYSEREGSSLIYMVDDLIGESRNPHSGYFLYNHDELFNTLEELKQQRVPTLLIGVTYALLDFVDRFKMDFPELIVMETGGMKGKRREMIREELHSILCTGFGVKSIHSEYGMTELLSQAYSNGEGLFQCPPWMDVLIRDTNDPLAIVGYERTGGVNIIDLANIDSCCFIATQDLGRKFKDGRFEVLGRFDNSDIRGCNLLVQ